MHHHVCFKTQFLVVACNFTIDQVQLVNEPKRRVMRKTELKYIFHSFPFKSAVYVIIKKKSNFLFLACCALTIQCILYIVLKAAKSLNQNIYHDEENLGQVWILPSNYIETIP